MFKLGLFLLLPVLAVAQLTPNSVTVTSSRFTNGQPDQVSFGITVHAGLDATLDEVLAAVRGAGLSADSFSGVNYSSYYGSDSYEPNPEDRPVDWVFYMATPTSSMKATVTLLSALQQSLGKEGKFRLSFQLSGISISARSHEARGCPLADLITDARSQAAKLAAAASAGVGSIQAISSPTISAPAQSIPYFGGLGTSVCSVTVKFALTGI